MAEAGEKLVEMVSEKPVEGEVDDEVVEVGKLDINGPEIVDWVVLDNTVVILG